jgi:hypothetical protein
VWFISLGHERPVDKYLQLVVPGPEGGRLMEECHVLTIRIPANL